MCLTGLQYSVRGRVSLVATYLFLLVHTPAELNAFDLYLLTRKVAQLCKKDWRDCKFVFPGFWLQVWLIGDGILASGGFLNDIDHYYLYSGKGEWGGLYCRLRRSDSAPCRVKKVGCITADKGEQQWKCGKNWLVMGWVTGANQERCWRFSRSSPESEAYVPCLQTVSEGAARSRMVQVHVVDVVHSCVLACLSGELLFFLAPQRMWCPKCMT